jgi:DNA-binding transcriptional ArsR family regulator
MKRGTDAYGEPGSFPLDLVARRLKALADASRLSVVRCLCEGERSVTEVVERTGLAQANVSKHLRVLRDEGLVSARRNHRNILYRVSSPVSEEICAIISRSIRRERAPAAGRRAGRPGGRPRARKAGCGA